MHSGAVVPQDNVAGSPPVGIDVSLGRLDTQWGGPYSAEYLACEAARPPKPQAD
jgi:hypothetical protein